MAASRRLACGSEELAASSSSSGEPTIASHTRAYSGESLPATIPKFRKSSARGPTPRSPSDPGAGAATGRARRTRRRTSATRGGSATATNPSAPRSPRPSRPARSAPSPAARQAFRAPTRRGRRPPAPPPRPIRRPARASRARARRAPRSPVALRAGVSWSARYDTVPAMHPLTLGTAGHIDHGKTVLVRALTGVDTDRLPEERERGISIELGYAPLDLPSGRRLSVVDVPGHERFVRTMVAGASGIDMFLLCVAADDGVMPQTREHLAVLRQLDVERGVVAITKADAADPAARSAAAAELVPGAESIAVSALEGTGLDELLAGIERVAAGLPGR